METEPLYRQPLKLKRNRVECFYTGGMLLDHFQKAPNPSDGYMPEEWVASMVEARNINIGKQEGLSEIDLGNNQAVRLKDLIEADPENYLGKLHAEKYGSSMGILVKLFDSYTRLMVQVHPDRDFAKRYLGSPFGKTEAWYILGGRKINGQDPYVLMGFKPGITKDKWAELFYKQDIEGMLNALHRIPVKSGDVFLIEAGMPHAVGPGCFLAEIQEPTDFTMRTEKVRPDGRPLDDFYCHQGAGFDKMLNCFHYDVYSEEELLRKWYKTPSISRREDGGFVYHLISSEDTSYFSMKKLVIKDKMTDQAKDNFSVAVILSGEGNLIGGSRELDVQQSDEIFIPAGAGDIVWQCKENTELEVVIFLPPL